MGMNKPFRLFTETAQEEVILNGNKRMQTQNYLRAKQQRVLKSCVPYLSSKE